MVDPAQPPPAGLPSSARKSARSSVDGHAPHPCRGIPSSSPSRAVPQPAAGDLHTHGLPFFLILYHCAVQRKSPRVARRLEMVEARLRKEGETRSGSPGCAAAKAICSIMRRYWMPSAQAGFDVREHGGGFNGAVPVRTPPPTTPGKTRLEVDRP
jgi:hypothetical protein